MEVAKGSHCHVPECQQFDFLPFQCEDCGFEFCVDHRSQASHNCTSIKPEHTNVIPTCPVCNKYVEIRAGESPDVKVDMHIQSGCKQYILNTAKAKPACTYPKCKSLTAPIVCKECHQKFCAAHRLPSDHGCDEQSDSQENHKKSLMEKFGIHRPKIMGGKNKDKDNNNLKPSKAIKKKKKIDVNKERRRMLHVAQGNNNIEPEDRFYVEVHFNRDTLKKRPIVMFFNKNKTVGRILDEICDARKIKNKNHMPNEKKLVIQCVRTGGLLPFDMPLHLMEPQVMSGDLLFMRYEDDPEDVQLST